MGAEEHRRIIDKGITSFMDVSVLEKMVRRFDEHDIKNAMIPAMGFIGMLRSKGTSEFERWNLDGASIALKKAEEQVSKHELISLNNIATVIGCLQVMNKRPGDAEQNDLLQQARYATRVLSKLVVFVQARGIRTEDLDIYTMGENMLNLLKRYRTEIRYVNAIIPKENLVNARQAHLERIIWNLCEDAYDAIKLRTTIEGTIILSARTIGKEYSIPAGREEMDYVCFQVEDNGIGMSQEQLLNIGTEGYSTKKTKDGHGLGLLYLRYLVNDVYKGWIEYISKEGEGTIARVMLPKARIEQKSVKN